MALKKENVGKSYEERTFKVEADRMKAYAQATNDTNPAYLDESREGGIVAQPIFNVVPAWEASGLAMADTVPSEDFPRLVHGEQDMEFHTPVRPGDVLLSTAKMISVDEKATGETATAEVTTVNQSGETTTVSRMTIFIRGGRSGGGARPPKEEIDRGAPTAQVTQTVDEDQTYRYAEASGDNNPIHLDENFAKMVGLPGIINHGLCTMAFTARAAVESLCGGDPGKLRRFKVRFSKPVLPGQSITTSFWKTGEEDGKAIFAFETKNEAGDAVIKDGVAEVATA